MFENLSMRYWILLGLALSSAPLRAHASESESVRGYFDSALEAPVANQPLELLPDFASGERLRKFNLVLNALRVPPESAPDFSHFPEAGSVASAQISEKLKYFDPDQGLRRYLQLGPDSVRLFQDFFTALIPQSFLEFSLALKPSGESNDSLQLIERLKKVAGQVQNPRVQNPLTGLKIVIDPGHMGTPFWDEQGGKFVKIGNARVSEGQLNLWTAKLVANQLETLGATVILTREIPGPVSPATLDTYDPTPYINQYFYDSLDDWMAPYLAKLSDEQLTSTIRTKPEVRKAYRAIQKTEFFISGEDLEARSKIIDREQPDLVLDIHYDASESNHLQSGSDSLEAFVPGSFRANETGSRKNKAAALKHLLEIQRWNESVALAADITQSMSQQLKIPVLKSPGTLTAVKVSDGVYARNLYINRRNLSALTVYLECLHYDHTREFYALANPTETGNYHGTSFQYPARLNLVANGIREGLLNYFKR